MGVYINRLWALWVLIFIGYLFSMCADYLDSKVYQKRIYISADRLEGITSSRGHDFTIASSIESRYKA